MSTKIKPLVSIVDDDESVRDALVGLVEWLGFGVQSFESAVDFLASPSVDDTACLIADVHMPYMTGVELQRRLVEQGRAIPTILITAYPNDAVRDGALADGAVCYLTKPVDQEVLIGHVRSAVRHQLDP
ncbi:MAG: response regulator [Alphaproteobacteria bacterium]|nr:response regulator [Alphaproteobacteria bacterium]MBV8407685.1 response regulator [Alphaproteobacteria bacterium]